MRPEKWIPLQTRAIFDFCKWDVQCEDQPVLSPFPLIIEPGTALLLGELAEALAREAIAAEKEILEKPQLIGQLGLPSAIQKKLRNAARLDPGNETLRVMRFDFHATPDGWRISEVNADVPGGFIEASGWNALFAEETAGSSAPPCTSKLYARAMRDAVGEGGLVALVHATGYSDDRQVMQHLARSFREQGLRTSSLSPAHLHWGKGRPEIHASFASGRPDAVVRFFPGEWLPNLAGENCWWAYFEKTTVPVSNPGWALVLQTKRFPMVWEELRTDLSTWRRLLPRTVELSEIRLPADDAWVIKPALGRVGERIGIRGVTTESDFQKILGEARRNAKQWVAQERFEISPVMTPGGEKFPCIGVFTIGGRAAGFYGRVSDNPIIAQGAQDVAVLIKAAAKGTRA